jgi:hypothetical protein
VADDFEVDGDEVEQDLFEQAMAEDGFTSVRRWLPARRERGAA